MEARGVKELILDTLYPPTCVVCAKGGGWMCQGCLASAGLRHEPEENVTPFNAVLSVGSYANPRIRRTLTAFKYRSAFCLEVVIREMLKRFRDAYTGSWPWAGESEMTVASIPTDPRHVRERGLDHASLIADAVRDVLVPWADRTDLLRRTQKSLPNASLPADATRQANVRGLFDTRRSVPESVLLVDDVLTTGATAVEAGETLKRAGTKRLYLVTMAKG